MRKKGKYAAPKKHGCAAVTVVILAVILCLLLAAVFIWKIRDPFAGPGTAESTTTAPTQTTAPTEPPWEQGYVASPEPEVAWFDAGGASLGTLLRGTQVEFAPDKAGKLQIRVDGAVGYLPADAAPVTDPAEVIPIHTLYVRTAVNLRDADGRLLPTLAEKGTALKVTGCDYVTEDGNAHMYRVSCDGEAGYVLPWYLVDNEADALANYDAGDYATHASRENRYGGGGAADLDYFPREKGPIEGNEMPDECRTLYIAAWRIEEVDAYLKIAEKSGINAFVVDITDGQSIGYAGPVMEANCPSAAAAATNTLEAYQAGIQKLKDAGYYVIGRITTFNDTYFIQDHPECAIANTEGQPMKLAGAYWPTAYNRAAWQYKVDLAVEAVELMGFHEIQFDYVRFPDLTGKYEKAGTIDFRNTYAETKAQAIQRFLMYAADTLRAHGAYISADVYGESAYNYVTAYGQYWAAISNVVDVISGMPYPDHFAPSGTWKPWEHPYETLKNWGKNVAVRQEETATPAVVRTWIQAYNAIKEPYNTYGPKEVAAQIRALRETGCTGGYMTWNSASSIDKYTSLISAFTPPESAD